MKILIVSIISRFLLVSTFGYHGIDYCKLNCGGLPSIGCNCYKNKSREEITDDIANFRQQIVDIHNNMRNKVARGDYDMNKWPTGGDMQILNYDLELEHLARCAVSSFSGAKTKCRKSSFCAEINPSELFCTKNEKQSRTDTFIQDCIDSWSIEALQIPTDLRIDYIDKFQRLMGDRAPLADFTLLVWAKMTRIGCARMWDPNNPVHILRYVMICNYAGENNYCSGNVIGESIYKRGPPCSFCGESGCNKNKTGGKYEALCGDLKETPTSILEPLPIFKHTHSQKSSSLSLFNHKCYKENYLRLLFSGIVPVFLLCLMR